MMFFLNNVPLSGQRQAKLEESAKQKKIERKIILKKRKAASLCFLPSQKI